MEYKYTHLPDKNRENALWSDFSRYAIGISTFIQIE